MALPVQHSPVLPAATRAVLLALLLQRAITVAIADETADPSKPMPRGLAESSPSSLDVVDEERVASAVQQLSSPEFKVRTAAQEFLVKTGPAVIPALEKAALHGELEQAAGCVNILGRLARDNRAAPTALSALQRISQSDESRVTQLANRTYLSISMSDAERSLAVLEAEGVRLRRGRDNEISSINNIGSDSQLARLVHFPLIRSIMVMGTGVTDRGLAHLSQLPSLSRLTIGPSLISGKGLSRLGDCPSLSTLSLWSQKLTADDLRQLHNVSSLSDLSLMSPADESVLHFLEDVRQIDVLGLNQLPLSKRGIEMLNRAKHLRRVSLSLIEADDEQLIAMGGLRVPLHLSVMQCPAMTDEGWQYLRDAHLTNLTLIRHPLTDRRLRVIASFESLEHLSVLGAKISDAGLESLAELKSMRFLSLRDTQVTEAEIEKLGKALPAARILVNGNLVGRTALRLTTDPETGERHARFPGRPTPADVLQLKQAPPIGTVSLTHDEVEDADLELLSEVDFKDIFVRSNNVSVRGLQALKDNPSLESLRLLSTTLNDDALVPISEMRSLRKLDIRKAMISNDGLDKLLTALSEAGQLTSLTLFDCEHVTDDGLQQIGQLTSLSQLALYGDGNLTSDLLSKIARLNELRSLEVNDMLLNQDDLGQLTSLAKLETLSLTFDEPTSLLTNEGLAHISRLSSLKSLSLRHSAITDDGMSSLTKLQGLESLDLARTRITDEGLAALAGHLPDLVRLTLTGTKVTDEGMRHVGRRTRLETLWLDRTQVGDEGLKHLDGLENLAHVMLFDSHVSSEGHARFRRSHPSTHVFR